MSCNGTHIYSETQRDCINMESGSVPVSSSIVKMSGSFFSHQAELIGLKYWLLIVRYRFLLILS